MPSKYKREVNFLRKLLVCDFLLTLLSYCYKKHGERLSASKAKCAEQLEDINKLLIQSWCFSILLLIFLNGIKNDILCLLMNQSTDSGHSNQSGATNEVLRPVLSRACRYRTIVCPRLAAGLFSRAWLLDCFPARDALNPFGLDSGLFRLTTNQGFLSSYSQTNVSLFIPLFNLPVKNYITI